MKHSDLKKKLLAENPEFKKAYLERDLALEISNLIILERVRKGYTQEQLAKMIGTKQSGIARSERGNSLPKLDLLERIAKALGRTLSIEFKAPQTETISVKTNPSLGQFSRDFRHKAKSPSRGNS